ncbi:E3 ubiquitin-protein ligase XB3-like protein [Hapsidospora chrysogenum ATCC 11550]|uniref:E3 ubiquitin-protein ligase XB3-like protein n=1 Tax=Hapsidospora chrysogenum (strain ATCC 11550 / CBS 779.69 / DSM 880 / IAM 14645 / JCM 23072 / IMI 49137) TaxID=857340 RepID=A0A086T867_HAPC1|nr:E3 ubiquitin-protein ligase XB3-like protein [Hapsidospora chrysogenum ATCC 11550]
MAPTGGYTVADLIESLTSIAKNLRPSLHTAYDLSSKLSRPGSQDGTARNPYEGLFAGLYELNVALEECVDALKWRLRDERPEEDEPPMEHPPPILESCRAMADMLTASKLDSLSMTTIVEIRSMAIWYIRAIRNSCTRTSSPAGILVYLSILPPDPPPGFQPRDYLATGIGLLLLPRQPRTSVSDEVDGDVVSQWLMLLNASFNNREPAEHHLEQLFLEIRERVIPEYSKAATQWPLHAARFWPVLKPHVLSLFRFSTFNFVQWALEFARGTWPHKFGCRATSVRPLIELTDSLCSGSISRLHLASAMGLPELCRDLLRSGADINQPGPWGTPLVCALLGWGAFEDRLAGRFLSCLSDPATYANRERVQTILMLLDFGADCRCSYYNRTHKQCSIMGPAFWASLVTQSDIILRRVSAGGAVLDSFIDQVLQYPEVEKECTQNKEVASRLLSYLFDLHLKQYFDLSNDAPAYIETLMRDKGLDFILPDGERQLQDVSYEEFQRIVNEMLDINWAFALRRLAMDPRFDPNARVGYESVRGQDTVLHNAVSADEPDVVDVLIHAGAKLDRKGLSGRTPVMVVESVQMLEKLVHQYGADTRAADNDGRRIWHYAAATNDMPLLEWLCEKDPWRGENMHAKTDVGRSPLAEAFLYIESLKEASHVQAPRAAPLAARRLLKECTSSSDLACRTPLTHVAAAWADLELINGLEALGADFRQLDDQRLSALHHLNFSATAEVVRKLQGLCAGAWIACQAPTPAESMFFNSSALGDSTPYELSAHPSCRRPLSTDAFSELLTTETMSIRDKRGAGLWKRFCEAIILPKEWRLRPRAPYERSAIHYRKSIATAVTCIIQAGGLKDYEREEKESAVCPLVRDSLPKSGSSDWGEFLDVDSRVSEYLATFIMEVLENSDPRLRKMVYNSLDGPRLLLHAVYARHLPLVRYLCSGGVQVVACVPEEKNQFFLALGFEHCQDREVIGELLKQVTAQELTEGQQDLFRLVAGLDSVPRKVEVLEMLLGKGMDPNYADPNSDGPSILARSFMREGPEISLLLLKHGADPRIGHPASNGHPACNAAVYAALAGNRTMLLEVIQRCGDDFPWADLWGPMEGPENILITACRQLRHEILEVLIEKVPSLRPLINCVVSGVTPAHLSARAGLLEHLRVLVRHGADLTVRGRNGKTPLHVASERLCSAIEDEDTEGKTVRAQVVRFLSSVDPRAAAIVDDDGMTPLDLLQEMIEDEEDDDGEIPTVHATDGDDGDEHPPSSEEMGGEQGRPR